MSKINKLGKSTFVIAILSFLLVAVLAFGGTYAYFSDAATGVSGGFKTGHLQLSAADTTNFYTTTYTDTIAVPGETLENKSLTIDVNSNINYFIRANVKIAITQGTEDYVTDSHTCGQTVTDAEAIVISITGWEAASSAETDGSKYYYPTYVENGKTPEADGTTTETLTVGAQVSDWVGAKGCTYYMDAQVVITVTFEVIQGEYLSGVTNNATLHSQWTTNRDKVKA